MIAEQLDIMYEDVSIFPKIINAMVPIRKNASVTYNFPELISKILPVGTSNI